MGNYNDPEVSRFYRPQFMWPKEGEEIPRCPACWTDEKSMTVDGHTLKCECGFAMTPDQCQRDRQREMRVVAIGMECLGVQLKAMNEADRRQREVFGMEGFKPEDSEDES